VTQKEGEKPEKVEFEVNLWTSEKVIIWPTSSTVLVTKFLFTESLTFVKELLLYLATPQHNIWQPRNIKLIATRAQMQESLIK
jgi:hypothetical protein